MKTKARTHHDLSPEHKGHSIVKSILLIFVIIIPLLVVSCSTKRLNESSKSFESKQLKELNIQLHDSANITLFDTIRSQIVIAHYQACDSSPESPPSLKSVTVISRNKTQSKCETSQIKSNESSQISAEASGASSAINKSQIATNQNFSITSHLIVSAIIIFIFTLISKNLFKSK